MYDDLHLSFILLSAELVNAKKQQDSTNLTHRKGFYIRIYFELIIVLTLLTKSSFYGQETKFCSRNDTTWFTTKLWNRFMGMFELTRKSGGDPLQTTPEKTVQDKWITEKVINQSVMCGLNSKATGLVSAVYACT